MENTLKRRKEKDRRKYILTDDVITKQREQHVFYFYHNIFIEKKELVTDQILLIKWQNRILNDQTELITDISILILTKLLIYWSNNYLTDQTQ